MKWLKNNQQKKDGGQECELQGGVFWLKNDERPTKIFLAMWAFILATSKKIGYTRNSVSVLKY